MGTLVISLHGVTRANRRASASGNRGPSRIVCKPLDKGLNGHETMLQCVAASPKAPACGGICPFAIIYQHEAV